MQLGGVRVLDPIAGDVLDSLPNAIHDPDKAKPVRPIEINNSFKNVTPPRTIPVGFGHSLTHHHRHHRHLEYCGCRLHPQTRMSPSSPKLNPQPQMALQSIPIPQLLEMDAHEPDPPIPVDRLGWISPSSQSPCPSPECHHIPRTIPPIAAFCVSSFRRVHPRAGFPLTCPGVPESVA